LDNKIIMPFLKGKLHKGFEGHKWTKEAKVKSTAKQKGRHYSIKTEVKKGCSPELHPSWKGGISKTSIKRWKLKNRDKVNFHKRQRIYLEKNAIGNHTFGEWELLKKQYGYTCPCCRKSESEIKLTEDHIIPLSKGGSDYIKNIQPLCSHCNSVKHMDIINYKLSFN